MTNSVDAEIGEQNSSTTILTASAVFTGSAEDVMAHSSITVFVDTDEDGTLSMEFSIDGENWDRKKSIDIDQANIGSGSVHTLEIVAQYFRVVYTNGSTDQTHFRLQSIYHPNKSGFLSTSPMQQISRSSDVQLMRVFNDPILDINQGLYADRAPIHRFGYTADVPNGTYVDVWSYAGTDATYNWPIAAETLRVRSGGNANDTSAGSGARTIQIIYHDASGNLQQDQLTLAGASASDVTTSTARRFIRAWVDTAGTILGNNTGNIIVENTTTNEVVGYITADIGQTQQSHYSVPLGFKAYLMRVHIDVAVGTNKEATVRMWQRQNAYATSAPFGARRLVRQWISLTGDDHVDFVATPIFPELTDIWIEAKGTGGTTEIDIDYDLICVRNTAVTVPQ